MRSDRGEGGRRAAAGLLRDAAGWISGAGMAWAHDAAPAGPVLHSARLALVDRRSRIRGYYDSGSAEAVQRLRRDARALLREPAPPAARGPAGAP